MSAIAQLSLFNPEGLNARAPTSSPTVRGFFHADYDVARLATAKPKSRVKYTETLGHWHQATSGVAGGGELLVSELEPPAGDAHILAFYRHLLGQPGRFGRERLSDSSIRRHLGRLKSILKLARKRGLLKRVPQFPEHAVDKAQRIERYWITADELTRLVAEPGPCDRKRRLRHRTGRGRMPSADWWRALILVVWNTAARISQVLALEWRDLHEDVLELRPLFKRQKVGQPKVIDARCVAALAKIRPVTAQPTDKIFAGLGPHANLAKHFQRLCAWAGIDLPPGSAWHSLRRGKCAEQFRQLGLSFAQEMLGHVDLATTEESYLSDAVKRAESIARQRAAQVRSAEEARGLSEGQKREEREGVTS